MRKYSYKELYDKFSLIVNLSYIEKIIKDPNVTGDFYKTIVSMRSNSLTNGMISDFTKSFLSKHQDSIDAEAYIFYTLKTILDTGLDRQYPNICMKCKQALKDSEYAYYEINPDLNYGNGDEIKRTTAKDLIGAEDIEESPNAKRIQKLSQIIDLRILFFPESYEEMKFYGKNEDLNLLITKLGFIEILKKVMVLSEEDIINLLKDNSKSEIELKQLIAEKNDELKQVDAKIFYGRIHEFVEKFPDEFDIDKILLIAGFRMQLLLEKDDMSDDANNVLSNILIRIRDNIENRKIKIAGLKPNLLDKDTTVSYSYKKLVEACNRISDDGIYLSTKKEDAIRQELISGEIDIKNLNPNFIRLLKFSNDEYEKIMKNHGMITFFTENGLLNNNDLSYILEHEVIEQNEIIDMLKAKLIDENIIKKYIKKKEQISPELFQALEAEGIFPIEEVFNFYMNDKIDNATINFLSEERKNQLASLLSIDKLIELYRDSEKQDDYIKYAGLTRNILLLNRSENEKNEVEEQIIEALGDSLENDDLVQMYKQHLISINTVREWGGDSLVADMMREAILKPNDLKEICKNGNYDCIIEIMKDPNIPRKNKIGIFYTTFADTDETLTEEQLKLRELAKRKCLGYMNFTVKLLKSQGASGIRGNMSVGKAKNEYVSDPLNRWNLIKLLDPEYSYEMLDQGMMIFKLPNLEGGRIILEKMFKRDVPDYGRATKILNISLEEFEKIKKQLIVNGDIPVSVIDKHPYLTGKVDSISHFGSWGQDMANLFNYKSDPVRTAEDIEKMDKEIRKILESRRIRNK